MNRNVAMGIIGLFLVVVLLSLFFLNNQTEEISFAQECRIVEAEEQQVTTDERQRHGLLRVYFTPAAIEGDVLALRQEIKSTFPVQYVCYKSKEYVLNEFVDTNSDNPVVMETLGGAEENPFGATLLLVSDDISEHEAIKQYINESDYIDAIDDIVWMQPTE